MEEWRDIPGYEGLYQVSNLGQIRKFLIRKSHPDNKGRPRMILSKNGKLKNFPISVLVALTFIGERPLGMFVCHGDGNQTHNSVLNLRYDTPKANSDDREKHGRTAKGILQPKSKLTDSDILEIREQSGRGEKQITIAKQFGVSQSLVSAIVRREVWSHV